MWCTGAALCKEVMQLVLGEGVDVSGFDCKRLHPKSSHSQPLWEKEDVTSPGVDGDKLTVIQAATLAYLWTMGCFTKDCEVDIYTYLRKTLEAMQGVNAECLIRAVRGARTWKPGRPLDAQLHSCFKGASACVSCADMQVMLMFVCPMHADIDVACWCRVTSD